MALFNWNGNRKKLETISQTIEKLNTENLALRAIHEFKIHSGQVNLMPDDPSTYLEQGYSGNTTVYSVVTFIDDMSKQAKLILKDKSGNTVEDHELLRFAKRVNKSTSFNDFKTQILIYRLVVGETFTYKLAPTAGVNKGKTIELHSLPAADVEIIEGTMFDPVRGYKVEGNYNVEMTVDEVHHSKMFNPNWGKERSLHGLSPLRAAAKTVSKLNQIEITEMKSFENQGPPYILSKVNSEGSMRMTNEQQDAYQKELKKAGKAENRNLPTVLKDEFKKLELGTTLADMTVIESSKSGIVALCGIWHFPPILLSVGEMTYNNFSTAVKAAWTNCIMPNLDAIADVMNACTIEGVAEYEAKGLRWAFDYSEVEELQEGMEVRVGWMTAAGWSGNDIYKATGKPLSDNPMMNEPRVPMGVSFLSDYSEPLGEGLKDFSDYQPK